MKSFNGMAVRAPLALASLMLLATLAGCAVDSEKRRIAAAGSEAVAFQTGRLVVVATDQFGKPLYGARVDIDGQEPGYYRNSGVLDYRGTTTFTGVPPLVRVTVLYPNGYYSTPFALHPNGTSEARVTVNLEGPQLTPVPNSRGATVY